MAGLRGGFAGATPARLPADHNELSMQITKATTVSVLTVEEANHEWA